MTTSSPAALTAADLPFTFGRYTLVSILGEGGMAKVFRAEMAGPAGFRKTVALKVIKSQMAERIDKGQRGLFKREARLGGLLRHPNLVDIYELGQVDDTWFLSMEWVDGLTLADAVVLGGALPPSVLLSLTRGLCRGLADAHDLNVQGQRVGLVHRDLKPSNVLLGWKGSVKIADFGMAHAEVRTWKYESSVSSGGSPGYMSPEQWVGGLVDHRSDLFSLGCVLYELAMGRYLFNVTDLASLRTSAVGVERRLAESGELQALDGRVAGLGEVVARCLRVDPGERYRSAAEVGAALARLEDRVPRKPAMLDWLAGLKGGDERGTGEAAETLDLDTAENNATVTERVEPSVGLRRSNLPLEPNIFVGRTGELTELSRLLEEGHRFVTVLGPPGTGKTRLTQRFGSQWLEAGQCESAWFCDLSEAKTGMGVLRAVASALDVPLKDGGVDETTLAQRLGHVIAGRGVTLLLIDNAEQVVEKVARWVRLWWERATEARFVVTSRVPLRLDQEQQLILDPLPLPKERGNLAALAKNDAVTLFVSRAQLVQPSFVVDADNADDVGAIVTELDGLPLAIELAAARVRTWSPKTMRTRLSDRFKMLSRPVSSGARRQTTLLGALDWSWDLLKPWERSALAQCSVFRGGFRWEAAEAVIDLRDWPEAPWVVDVLVGLVEHSLVMVGEGPKGHSRLALLVSVLAYATDKLAEQSMEAAREAGHRHAQHYATYGTEEHLESLKRHGGVGRWVHLHGELQNLLVATTRAAELGWPVEAAGTCMAALSVLSRVGPYGLAQELIERVLELDVSLPVRALLLMVFGFLRSEMGRVEEVQECYEQALVICKELGARRLQGRLLGNLGVLYHQQGHTGGALEHYERALAIHREVGDRRVEGGVLSNLGRLCRRQGRMEEAMEYLQQALAIHQEVGDRRSVRLVLLSLGNLRSDQGQIDEALGYYNQALDIHREVGSRRTEGVLLGNLGSLHEKQGRMGEALACYTQALTIHQEMGSRQFEGHVLGHLGRLSKNQGRMGEAMALYNRALAIHREVGDREYEGIVLGSLGNLHQIQNRQEEALAHYTQALTIHRDVGDLRYEGRVMNHLGRLYMKQGQKDEALAHYTQALAIAEEGGYRRSECEVLGNLGLLLASQGELVSARQHLAKAVGLLRKVLDSFLLGFVLCARGQVDLLAEDLPAARAALAEAEAITETLALTSEAPLRREIEGLRAALSEPR